MIKKTLNYFDKLEDRVRGRLSRFPIFYAFVGGVGIVIFWRGIWHTADFLMLYLAAWRSPNPSVDLANILWWDGPLSILIGGILLLISGLFVSNFIGNEIIISGLRGEKKLTEKIQAELEKELKNKRIREN